MLVADGLMNRSKLLILTVFVVGAVVALEEWRIAGLRGRIGTLERELAAAVAAIPPPPRPVPAGESPDEALRRSKAQRVMENTRAASIAQAVTAGGDAAEPGEAATDEAGESPAGGGGESGAPAVADSQLRTTVIGLYGNLIRRFQLEGEEAEYFINLLAEGVGSRQRLTADLLGAKSPAERAGVRRRAEEEAVRFADRVRTFLASEEDFAVYRDFVSRLAGQQAGRSGG
jgi:hypothetical protein